MPLCGSKKNTEEGAKNQKIDKKIKADKKKFKLTHRIPVVGAGESGKSTLLKQMQILYMDGFTDDDRREKVKDIRRNIRDGLISITSAMPQINPPVELENLADQFRIDYIQTDSMAVDFDYPKIFFEHVRVLWKDRGVQESFSRANEYQLIDSAKFFLDKSDEVGKDDYLPDNQDMLRCRVLTSGIFETKFSMNKIHFHMFDVGGQREERRKWIQVFHDVTAVIFVCACSAYDMTLREAANKNRLEESISVFSEVWCNRYLSQTSVILFLNKQDLFETKILSGKTQLETFFPAFKNYHVDTPGSSSSAAANGKGANSKTEDPLLTRAKAFIRDQFLSRTQKANDGSRRCYPHYTTAVDTENIKKVFNSCQDMLQRSYMARMGLL